MSAKPYHHRHLRRAVIDAALVEIRSVGAARMSMREIARRAGVSHAAPAHHFGDKKGIFTAIATEGFTLLREANEPRLAEPGALLHGGLGYIAFAVTHPAHFEVMFRPDLCDAEDADLKAARDGAFAVLYSAVEQGIGSAAADEVAGTAMAAWSLVHGFSALALGGNFPPEMTGDPDRFAALLIAGLVSMARITSIQAESGVPSMESFGIRFPAPGAPAQRLS